MMTSAVSIPLIFLLIQLFACATVVSAGSDSVSCGAFLVCPAGCYASVTLRFPNNTIECVTVGRGYYSAGDDNFRHPCPAGKYSPITNSKICYSCDKGSYSQGLANSACRLCPRGTYQDGYGQSYCETCDSDHLYPLPGSDSAFFAPNGTVYCDFGRWPLTRPPPEVPLPSPSISTNPSTSNTPSVVSSATPFSAFPNMGPSPHPSRARLIASTEAEPSATGGLKKAQITATSIFVLLALATLGLVLSSGRRACDCQVHWNGMSNVPEPRPSVSTGGVTGDGPREEINHANRDVEQGNTTRVSAVGVTGAEPREELDNANHDAEKGIASLSTDHRWLYQHHYRFGGRMLPVVEEESLDDNSESPYLEDDVDDSDTSHHLS
jgi:Tyrosine-protein kinase ephrin type A/B receptor-like